ncbi:MAG: cytochrome c biogenesis protein CcsA [Gammaproteobacteria bacterium]|nr:cytochrome c biogenesis protein CcsA [Gammaproteobacteria bacterium]
MVAEVPWLWSGLGAYFTATLIAIWGVAPRFAGMPVIKTHRHEYIVLAFLVLGVTLLAIAIGERWVRIGHGPWISLFELLMSQLWSLGLIFLLLYWRLPGLRPSAVIVLPVMWILGTWVLTLEPTASHFPATYYNSWKWVHVGLGKVFLALLLAGVGLAGVLILRQTERGKLWFKSMPSDVIVDRLAWRFMMLALVFDSLMLIAGAVWAQDAWGRYWAWDPLETSAFLTWLFLAIGLHVRLSYRVPPIVSGLIIIGVFMMAFATYFGTPYISPAAHKGMV